MAQLIVSRLKTLNPFRPFPPSNSAPSVSSPSPPRRDPSPTTTAANWRKRWRPQNPPPTPPPPPSLPPSSPSPPRPERSIPDNHRELEEMMEDIDEDKLCQPGESDDKIIKGMDEIREDRLAEMEWEIERFWERDRWERLRERQREWESETLMAELIDEVEGKGEVEGVGVGEGQTGEELRERCREWERERLMAEQRDEVEGEGEGEGEGDGRR